MRRRVPHRFAPHHHLPLGAQVAQLATLVREAASTDAAAAVLTELTVPHDGILAAIDDILRATADFHAGLDQAADPHIARRLHRVADEHLRAIRTDLAYTHNALADRHTPVLARSGRPEQRPVREAKTLHDVRVPAAVA